MRETIRVAMLSTVVALGSRAAAEPITAPAFPGKCVEAFNQGQSLEGGALLRLADCNGSTEQDFRFDSATSRLVLHRLAPQLCVDVFAPPLNGAGVRARVCNDTATQKWAFPFDSRVRPVGVDANKCLTHATRPGKPATGWAWDSEVVDFGCQLPEDLSGGGGFCVPTFAVYYEMMLSTCDRSNVQRWTLQQEGMSFPPDGIVSSRVDVTVKNMRIDDCREAGTCDWRLHCGIGHEADIELIGKVAKNTGDTIEVNRSLTHQGGMPVTVTCHVREFDRGILDPDVWEVVGTVTRTFGESGPATIQMDNDEGKVTIHLAVSPPLGTIQQPLTVEPRPAVATKIEARHALGLVNVDAKVPEADLAEWLKNPQFTPYPATAGALIKLLGGRRLTRAVSIDVIRFHYEKEPGRTSPRRVADVDMAGLARAVVAGHNSRYGESVSDLQSLLARD